MNNSSGEPKTDSVALDTVDNIDAHLLLDILSDGMDYAARGFWAQIDEYKWYWWYKLDEHGEPINDWLNPDLTPDTVLIRMRDDEDGEADNEEREFVDITLRKLAAATHWALDEFRHLYTYHVENGIINDIDYDGTSSDVIIQRIVLGEVVYG